MKLLVRNLARATTENQIRELFEKHGTIQYCTLVLDKTSGESKGFGFVEMPRPGDAKAAIKNLNGIEIDGNKIRVKNSDNSSSADSSSIDSTSTAKEVDDNPSSKVAEVAEKEKIEGDSKVEAEEKTEEETEVKSSIWPDV
jgi:RNA recognition motif-containing protein